MDMIAAIKYLQENYGEDEIDTQMEYYELLRILLQMSPENFLERLMSPQPEDTPCPYGNDEWLTMVEKTDDPKFLSEACGPSRSTHPISQP
jgi:hypothetical protein